MTVSARLRKDRGFIEYSIVGTYPDGEQYGVHPNGKAKQLKSPLSTVTATIRWAENTEKEMHRAWEEKREHGFKAPTLKEAYDDYMQHSRTKRNAAGTLEWKKIMWGHISKHIPPDVRIDKIHSDHMAKLVDGIGGKAKSVNNVLGVFSGILRLAQRKKKIVHLPIIEMLKVPESMPKFLHPDEFDRYLIAAREIERAGIWQPLAIGLLGGIAGLRRGEMLAIEQKIIDYAGRRLPVVASSYKGESVPTKGKRFRVVGMNDELAAVLKRNRHLRGPLVFYTAKGKPGTYKALYRWFDMACAQAKLTPSGKLHVLRHTFGSLAASAGVDLHRIQSSLGHSDQRTTEIYARMAAQAALEVTGKIDKYLRSAKAKAHK